jgi:hypothetical protein
MGSFDISLDQKTVDQVSSLFEAFPKAAESILKSFATTIKRMVQGRTPIGWTYVKSGDRKTKKSASYKKSGALKASWQGPTKEGNAWVVYTGLPYASVLEEGKYPGVGAKPSGFPGTYPRTVGDAGGIYSTQAVGGIVGPMLEDKESPLGPGLTLKAALAQLEADLARQLARFK